MDNGLRQSKSALIGEGEYRFIERLSSAGDDGGEVIVCERVDGARRYAARETWEAGCLRFDEEMQGGPSLVTAASSDAEKLALFRSRFAVRDDVYAKSYFNKKTSGVGYTPACSKEWISGVCAKPRVKCADCAHREFLPLDDAVLKRHFIGSDREGVGVVAGYPLIDEDKTRMLAIDLDKADWESAVLAFRCVCDREGVPIAVERSRSGNGAHVWLFFEELVEASDARKLGCALVTQAMQADPRVRFDSYDRLFPNQDSVPIGGFGNPIALPFQGAARLSGNSLFVDESFIPYPGQWRFLSSTERISSEDLARLLRRFGKRVLGDLADADASDAGELLGEEKDSAGKGQKSLTTPWSTKTKVKLTPDDMPDHVRVVRSNLLYIAKEGMSSAALNKLKRVAAFGNPEFYRAQAMRQSVYGKPRVLYFGEDAGDWLGLPRGCEDAVVKLLVACGSRIAFEDERFAGKPIKVEFNSVLRPEQEPALDALTRHDIGVLVAPTAFGKTVVAANLIAHRKTSTLVLVPRATLLEQWQQKLLQFLDIDEELPELLTPTGRPSTKKRSLVGQIGGGKRLPSGIVDVALVPALFEKGDLPNEKQVSDIVQQYGMVICDECHHVPAFSFEQVMRAAKARYVYGLTATPKRSDGLHAIAFMQCGPVRCRAGKAQDGESSFSRIMIPRFTKTRLDAIDGDNYTQILEALSLDAARNDLIVGDVARVLDEGRTPLVLTKRVDHATLLEEALRLKGYETMLLVGSDPQRLKREKLRMVERFGPDKPFAIVATGSYIGEGFDDDRLDALFLAAPVAWGGLVAQYVGRLHRRREGKLEVVVYDYVDMNVRMLDRMYRKRLKEYASQGYELRPASGKSDVRGEFVAQDEFLERFERDVDSAAKTVLVASSEVHKRRTELLSPCIERAVVRGAEVRVILPEPESAKPKKANSYRNAAALFERAGAIVSFGGECPNLAVFDECTVWYGGIAPFAFPRADDQILRFVSGEVACELRSLMLGGLGER